MVLDVTRTFIQTNITTKKDGKERAIKKITGVLVEMILELDSETYSKRVVYENGKEVIYVVVLRSIYGIFVASILFYKKFCGDLENIGFEFNPSDTCVSNRINVGKQHTVIFHVD